MVSAEGSSSKADSKMVVSRRTFTGVEEQGMSANGYLGS